MIIKRPMIMHGGEGYSSGLSGTKSEMGWKEKLQNDYNIFAKRIISLAVFKHDIEVQGAEILECYNVTHGFRIRVAPEIAQFVAGVPFIESFKPAYDMKALHG